MRRETSLARAQPQEQYRAGVGTNVRAQRRAEGCMIYAGIFGVLFALLWIGWELHRIAQLAVNFTRGYEGALQGKYVRPF
jgi:hypothetical protein